MYIQTNENENTTARHLWDSIKAVLREIRSNISLPQETRETSNKQPNITSKATTKIRKE